MDIINKRRSTRTYKDKPVEKEKIEELLKAAMQAPSAYNQQAWEFIVIENEETRQKISNMSPYAKPLENAPLAIIVLADQENMKVPECWQQDLGAATENLLLEAVELGLGGVWLAAAPFESRMGHIKDMFSLPDSIKPFAVVAIGYPAEATQYIDRYEKSKVHFEKW